MERTSLSSQPFLRAGEREGYRDRLRKGAGGREVDPFRGAWNDPGHAKEDAMSRENYATTVYGWKTLGSGLETNAGDHQNLEGHRLLLDQMTERADTLVARRNALEAEKQAVTRELQTLLDQGRTVATFLRAAMRQHYGTRSEKLVEFGLRPFRRRSRKAAAGPPST
jgi:hypothetical protein